MAFYLSSTVEKLLGRFVTAYETKVEADRRSSIVNEATLVYKLYGQPATVKILNKIKTK